MVAGSIFALSLFEIIDDLVVQPINNGGFILGLESGEEGESALDVQHVLDDVGTSGLPSRPAL